jgi:hypothetical protein
MLMTIEADERAKGVDLPPWWLEKVREMVDERKETIGESLGQLGEALADAVGREEAWDHSVISRFLRNKNTTVPLAEAFAVLLGIPRPFFVPRSFDEALSMQQVLRRYDGKGLTPDQQRRLHTVDQVAAAAAQDAADQTRGVPSKDEGTSRRGRTGRAARRRSSAS